MKRLFVALVLSPLLFLACGSNCPAPDSPAEQRANAPKDCPPFDAGAPLPLDAGRDVNAPLPRTCAGACTRMRDLGCDLGKPTPKGGSCEQVCTNVQINNAGAGFNIVCIVEAKACNEAEACR